MDDKTESFDSQFSLLNAEWSSLRENMFKDMQGFTGNLQNTFSMRISFYEKLILLASGTFALSLTLLSSLHGHAPSPRPLAGIHYLHWSWVLMLVSILFSWGHNLIQLSQVETVIITIVKGVTIGRFAAVRKITSRMGNLSESHSRDRSNFDQMSAQAQQSMDEAQKTFASFQTKYKSLSRYAGYTGVVALLGLITAFTLLLIFALKNSSLL
jgi:hypothetical protein